MRELTIVRDAADWQAALAKAGPLDFYYTHDYHRIASSEDGAEPIMLVYEHGCDYAIYPFLRRSLPNSREFDGISVHGYCGPVTNSRDRSGEIASAMLGGLRQLNIVSVFMRLHPVIGLDPVCRYLGRVVHLGTTVSIDLNLPQEEQVRRYRGSTRRDIRKLRSQGVVCQWDEKLSHMTDFMKIYRDTMKKVGAAESYWFSDEYFRQLVGAASFEMRLYECRVNGQPICAGLFSFYEGIVQYHLSGTDVNFLHMAPTKLMIDTVRAEAAQMGMTIMHLGGGVGGREDSLFRFKAGFSRRFHEFVALEMVVNKSRYDALCAEHGCSPDEKYFPAYRKPTGIEKEQRGGEC